MSIQKTDEKNKRIYLIGSIFFIILIVSFTLMSYPNENSQENTLKEENCNENILPQSICLEGKPQTKATPDHQRPCSVEILFGGEK
ncbi:MAG: hypothetical protein ACOC56_01925 [Atribacterota bacterium]